ncbi:DUF1385 domain-containing protein [Desulfosporosinus shakirovi]|uniref:DUF1385 domain-containing protein n=1 Tax=Desulfosporosinus shakirovi TaxID=2885154 RepID=UPI001E336612|nr:DUF1385 domain-containing protein [Desulfosporosinus sp. SRJS8]MCB8816255.1 DUF1385 domain-containing protein [Desulfosporosinus sp. SRJS8]
MKKYHGADYKAIFTYEAGQDLTVDNARVHSLGCICDPRYGTCFLPVVVVVRIFIFAFVGLYPLW